LPVYSILYNISLFNPGLLLVVLLGSTGYAAIGTLLSSMRVQTRTRDVLLPVFALPGDCSGFTCSGQGQRRIPAKPPNERDMALLNILIAYDVIFTAISFMVFELW